MPKKKNKGVAVLEDFVVTEFEVFEEDLGMEAELVGPPFEDLAYYEAAVFEHRGIRYIGIPMSTEDVVGGGRNFDRAWTEVVLQNVSRVEELSS